jgi:hypothetical protein
MFARTINNTNYFEFSRKPWMVFINDKSEKPWKTIDRQRNAVLICQGQRGGDAPQDFEFSLDGQTIKFSAWRYMKRSELKKYDMRWQIIQVSMPQILKNKKEEIFELIKESLNAYGLNYSKEQASSVEITFSPDLK